MRVYFDASVIIAALISSSGGSSLLLQLTKKNTILGITSQTVIEEVLAHTHKIQKTREEIEQFVIKSGFLVREAITLHDISKYENKVELEDAHVVAGAILTKCEYLVTLDKKHLLSDIVKKRFLPLKMVSPKGLLTIIFS